MADLNAANSGQVQVGTFTVNRLGFGAMRITGEGIWGEPRDHAEALTTLRRAAELGVNFIDTADSYGPEVSENLIHEALYPYEGIVIATKGGLVRPGPHEWRPDGSPQHLREALQGSLQRLGVNAIDVYQFHRVDPAVPFEDSLLALVELKDKGKIKHIGLSNVSLEQLQTAQGMTEIASVQNRYNIFSAVESEGVLEYCTQQGIVFIPYFPIGGNMENLDALQQIAAKHAVTTRQIALAWLLAHSPVIVPIPGTSSVKHLEENIAAANIQLDQDDLAQLDSMRR